MQHGAFTLRPLRACASSVCVLSTQIQTIRNSRPRGDLVAVIAIIAFFLSHACVHAACVTTATSVWHNVSINNPLDSFSISFDATPAHSNMDGVFGLSQDAAFAYPKLAAIVRFNTSNRIDARNGGDYQADIDLAYQVGQKYRIRFVVSMKSRTYSVFVTPPGSSSERLLAKDYSFRTEQANVSVLNNWAVCASIGSMQLCDSAIVSTEPNEPPVAIFETACSSTSPPFVVQFDGSKSYDTNGTIIDYLWSFGDGALGNGMLCSHIYAKAGTYNVYLIVTDNQNARTITSANVVVAPAINKPPVAVMTTSTTNGHAPLSVNFNGSGSYASAPNGTITNYAWDFGDGSTGTGPIVTHIYTSIGSKTVTLTVTDHTGMKNSTTTNINVTEPPTQNITSTPNFQNFSIPNQTGVFTLTFDAVPAAANMEGGIGLSNGATNYFTDTAIGIRFGVSGKIEARHNSTYSGDTAIPYIAGKSYHFRVIVNIASRTYSVYVTPTGSTEVCLGSNYSFRPEQLTVSSLNNWVIWSSISSFQIRNVNVSPGPAAVLEVSTTTLDFGSSTDSLSFDLWNSGASSLNFTVASNVNWLTVSPTSGSSTVA